MPAVYIAELGVWLAGSASPPTALTICIPSHDEYVVTTGDEGVALSAIACDFWINGLVPFSGVPDPRGRNGYFAEDPLFVDRTRGDYHPRTGYPCIDK